MADLIITPSVDLGLGGSLTALVLARSHYKFWDMVPINSDLSIRQRMSVGTPPTGWSSGDTLSLFNTPLLRAAGALPEGGLGVTLDGVSEYMASVYDETSVGIDIGPHTLWAVVTIHALPSAGQEPAVIGGSTEFAVTARDDGRLYGYYNGSAVVDLPFALDVPLFICLTRTDASPDVVTLYVNDASDAATPTNGTIVRGYVHLGKHWSNAHFLEATYSHAGFLPEALSGATVAAWAAASQWTDVSEDVQIEPALVCERGIRDDSPLSRVASTGTCTLAMDNSERNAAGLVGYYSPAHANCRSGFTRGAPIRVRVDDGSTDYTVFVGRIAVIAPIPGIYGSRETLVLATDIMDDAARFRLNQLPILENVRSDEVFEQLVVRLPNQPFGLTLFPGNETYDIALDNTEDEAISALSEFNRLAHSEYGRIYQSRVGALVHEGRDVRGGVASSLTVEDTEIIGLAVRESTRDAINRVEVTVHPREVDDAATTVLFALVNPLELAANVAKTILGPYRVEGAPDTVVRVGGLDMEPPLASTDYLMFENADGTGADLTSTLAVVANYGANGVSYTLTSTSNGFVTRLQARGRGVYDFRTVVVIAEDAASIAANGVNALKLEMPYQEDPDVAQAVAEAILASYSPVATRARQMVLYANDEALAGIVGKDVSDRISLSETLSGLSADHFINGVRFEFLDGVVGKVTWWLAPPEDELAA